MRLYLALSLLLTFVASLAAALEQDHSADIFYWPISASKPQPLAKISHNSTTGTVKAYTPPSTLPPADEIVRVGFQLVAGSGSGQWTGIATRGANFAPEKAKTLVLHVKPDGALFNVGFRAGEGGKDTDGGLEVEVVQMRPGAGPTLNKPVVVDPHGKVEEKEPEKTFLQKYWWAIALFLVLQFVSTTAQKE